WPRRLLIRRRSGGQVAADAILVDAVARQIERVGIHLGVEQIRIAEAPDQAVSVAVEVRQRLDQRSQDSSAWLPPEPFIEDVASSPKRGDGHRTRRDENERGCGSRSEGHDRNVSRRTRASSPQEPRDRQDCENAPPNEEQ